MTTFPNASSTSTVTAGAIATPAVVRRRLLDEDDLARRRRADDDPRLRAGDGMRRRIEGCDRLRSRRLERGAEGVHAVILAGAGREGVVRRQADPGVPGRRCCRNWTVPV